VQRGIESVGDLDRNFQRFVHREWLPRDAMLEGLALHQLHRQEGAAIVLADFVNRTDMGMIQVRAVRASRWKRLSA